MWLAASLHPRLRGTTASLCTANATAGIPVRSPALGSADTAHTTVTRHDDVDPSPQAQTRSSESPVQSRSSQHNSAALASQWRTCTAVAADLRWSESAERGSSVRASDRLALVWQARGEQRPEQGKSTVQSERALSQRPHPSLCTCLCVPHTEPALACASSSPPLGPSSLPSIPRAPAMARLTPMSLGRGPCTRN